MEQVFNFKLTRLGARAVGSPIGKMDGWPGRPAGEQEQAEGRGAERGGSRGASRAGQGGSVLRRSVLSANPELQASLNTSGRDAALAHPPTMQGSRRKA